MKWHESNHQTVERKHRVKGAWRRPSDAELALIDAEVHRHKAEPPRRSPVRSHRRIP